MLFPGFSGLTTAHHSHTRCPEAHPTQDAAGGSLPCMEVGTSKGCHVRVSQMERECRVPRAVNGGHGLCGGGWLDQV